MAGVVLLEDLSFCSGLKAVKQPKKKKKELHLSKLTKSHRRIRLHE